MPVVVMQEVIKVINQEVIKVINHFIQDVMMQKNMQKSVRVGHLKTNVPVVTKTIKNLCQFIARNHVVLVQVSF